MNSPSIETDFCILGAGLAGLSLADALQENGYGVIVIEKNTIASGASGTPGGLVNPATGRRATKSWKAEACYKAIAHNLKKVQSYSESEFYRTNGVLRPALTGKMAGKMHEQIKKADWPDGWCHWLSEKEIKDFHPGITCVEGGLWLPIGITVQVGKYLKAFSRYLHDKGVRIFTGRKPRSEREAAHWFVHAGDQNITARHLVFATGYQTGSFSYWKDIPLHPIKGQVACFKCPKELLNFRHSISSLGYIARIDGSNQFIQGSTYEHDFEDTAPDAYGEKYLRNRLGRTLPYLKEKAELISQWGGVRVSTPNRKPVLGRHKEFKNLHLFTGLGSKGLLYSKFLADHYVDYLHNEIPLYASVAIERFYES